MRLASHGADAGTSSDALPRRALSEDERASEVSVRLWLFTHARTTAAGR
jgi:hypothetical protein